MKEPERNDGRPVDKKFLAEYFGVTERTVENWMARGLIPFWKISRLCRFDLDQVKRALNERCGRNIALN